MKSNRHQRIIELINEHSIETTIEYNKKFQGQDHITIPFVASDELIEKTLKNYKK